MRQIRILCFLALVSCAPDAETHIQRSGAPPGSHFQAFAAELTPVHGVFQIEGRAVPPEAVALLMTNLSETIPSIAAVDLEGFIKNHGGACTVSEGTVHSDLPDFYGSWGGYVEYRDLGTSPSGTHVLEVSQCGGGSGVFQDLVFVRIEIESTCEQGYPRQRHVLRYLGSFVLGDRDDGIVHFDGHYVVIGPSRYRTDKTTLTIE